MEISDQETIIPSQIPFELHASPLVGSVQIEGSRQYSSRSPWPVGFKFKRLFSGSRPLLCADSRVGVAEAEGWNSGLPSTERGSVSLFFIVFSPFLCFSSRRLVVRP